MVINNNCPDLYVGVIKLIMMYSKNQLLFYVRKGTMTILMIAFVIYGLDEIALAFMRGLTVLCLLVEMAIYFTNDEEK